MLLRRCSTLDLSDRLKRIRALEGDSGGGASTQGNVAKKSRNISWARGRDASSSAKPSQLPCFEDLSRGLSSFEQLWQWPTSMLQSIPVSLADHISECFQHTLHVSTHFSGMGSGETAISFLIEAFCQQHGESPGSHLSVYHACEKDSVCQRVLLGHAGCTRPLHLFDDIMNRINAPTRMKMTKMLAEARVLAKEQIEREGEVGVARKAKIGHQIGFTLLKSLGRQLTAKKYKRASACAVHGRLCEHQGFAGGARRQDLEGLVVNLASPMCTDFSAMNRSPQRLLGDTILTWAVWAHERRLLAEEGLGEDFIIHENVIPHPSKEMLDSVLGKHFWPAQEYAVSPNVLGFPFTRERRFTICISRQWTLRASLGSPITLFGKAVAMMGHEYFSAPEDVTHEWLKALARKKGMKQGVSARELLTPAEQGRLDGYEDWVATAPPSKPYLWDLKDTVGFKKPGVLMFGPQKHSNPWSHSHQRMMMPGERLQLMGFPVGLGSSGSHVCPFMSVWPALSTPQVASMVGNGVHLPCAGSAFLRALLLDKQVADTVN